MNLTCHRNRDKNGNRLCISTTTSMVTTFTFSGRHRQPSRLYNSLGVSESEVKSKLNSYGTGDYRINTFHPFRQALLRTTHNCSVCYITGTQVYQFTKFNSLVPYGSQFLIPQPCTITFISQHFTVYQSGYPMWIAINVIFYGYHYPS